MVTNNKMRPSEAITQWGRQLYGDDFNLRDPKLANMYKNAFYYFKGNQEQTMWDCRKGLMLIGPYGVGKSALFKVMQRMFNNFQIIRAKELCDQLENKEIGRYGVLHTYGKNLKKDLMIDDIGTENTQMFLFKNEVNVIEEIILDRYENFIDMKIRTHGTSNLLAAQMKTLYGDRSYDRMKEMFNLITWEGKSLRK
jgi:DNA replication protein DnaC